MMLRPFCPTGIPIANQWRQCKRSGNIYVEACPSVQAVLDPSYIHLFHFASTTRHSQGVLRSQTFTYLFLIP